MSALQSAVKIAGGQAALALAIGVKQQHVWNWLNRENGQVPPERCVAIEVTTCGAVTRRELRPDDWHRIWPELIGADGAPDVPQAEEARDAA